MDNLIDKSLKRIEDTPEVTYFVLNLFDNTPLSFFGYHDGWFNFNNDGEIAFRYDGLKKIGNIFSYRLELNFKPANTNKFEVGHDGTIVLHDFLNGDYGNDDSFEYINIRLYEWHGEGRSRSKEILFELILK